VTATGGSYASESDKTTVTGTSSISALVDSATSNVSGLWITPVTEFINSDATTLMKGGSTEAAAHAAATTLLDGFYSFTPGTKPETLQPKFTKADITGSPDSFKLGYIISTLALDGHNLKPSSPDDLIADFSADISDGVWDGLQSGTQIALARKGDPEAKATGTIFLSPTTTTSDWEISLNLCLTACSSVTSAGIGVLDVNALLASMAGGISACTCVPAAVGLNASSAGAVSTLAYTPAGMTSTHQYVFVAGRNNGVIVIDVTDPTVAAPLVKKWASVATTLGGPVGGVIPVIIPGLGHPDLVVYAFQSSKKVALLNIDKLIESADPDPLATEGTATLPIKATSPVSYSGGSAYVSGGVPAGGTIILCTADGYALVTESSILAGTTFSQVFPVQDTAQIPAENMGADIVHDQILGGNYRGIDLVDLNLGVNQSYYMSSTVARNTWPNFDVDGNSVDTKYRVGIMTNEDSPYVDFLNMSTIKETAAVAPALNTLTAGTGGAVELRLGTSGPTISGSAVDPSTHLALFMAGFSDDLAVGLVQDPNLPTSCPTPTTVTTWQGLCDWKFMTINTASKLAGYTFATDPHAVGVVLNQGLGNAKTAGRVYGYLLDNSGTPGVVQVDMAGFLAMAPQGTTGDAAHKPLGDPSTTAITATGDVVLKEYKF